MITRIRASRRDGESANVRSSYSFGDGSGPENGRRANHNYRQPGTYTATVTATDREGASSTAEAEITVTPVAVNLAPSVTFEATPQTGTTPLDVSFSAAGVDPEGGALDYRSTFGDQSTGASGSEVGHGIAGAAATPLGSR